MFLCLFFFLECLSPYLYLLLSFPFSVLFHFPLWLSSLIFLFAPLISFIALHLDSAALATAATPVRLQCLTLARGAFFCGKPMCSTLHVEFRRRWGWIISAKTVQTSAMGINWGSSHKTHHSPFSRQCWAYSSTVLELLFQLQASSPRYTEAVKVQVAEKYVRELTHGWQTRLCRWLTTEYAAWIRSVPLLHKTTNITEI